MRFVILNSYNLYKPAGLTLSPKYEKVYIRADLIESIKSCETHSSILVVNEGVARSYLVKETPEEVFDTIKDVTG
ncbi:hypothetical protein HMI01_14980 [Halolactibacillus miurensis]|uniref:Uncharacterized protein n=1 Tax=Halolactibacillus miurensis TaxID=306541 RepID=A0A1I6S0G0_9BACI|nr:hypothetical protein HMI01_14980 [Halolactibacillus miurensis]SFS70427.1 hypothetical protein SAMN05421668_10765 [Halolactibacillus miurensis]